MRGQIGDSAKLKRNKHVVKALDMSLTPYYLRHTYCTNLAEAGVPLRTAMALMGHSDIKMTARIYTHVTDKMLGDAIKLVDAADGSGAGERKAGKYRIRRRLA